MSTVALSVRTSTRGASSSTWSPTLTCHSAISASVTPSPMSGRRKTNLPKSSALQRLLHRLAHALGPGEVIPFEGVRIGRVPAGDPADRRLQGVEAALLDQGGQLGPEA